jgi:YfiH family protein
MLSGANGVRHAFFTREGGVSGGVYASLNAGHGSADDSESVAENRRRMAAALDAATLSTPYQTHSIDVALATEPWNWQAAPRADAVVTAVPGLAIGVSIADCCPILFADSASGVIGAAHAGWKGALSGIVEATLAAMRRLGAKPESTMAAIGVCIRQPSYEVGEDFFERFVAEGADNGRFFERPRGGKPHFDLPGFVAARLRNAGVSRIEDLGLDTYADEARFFSYRRMTHRGEPDYGRHVAAIALADR